jgi:tripartite-type tricarboxylate transporter receptor subunit TctC
MEIAPMKRRRVLLLLAFTAALPIAHAQTGKWPEKPVRMVVPFPPGGATDLVARLVSPRLSEEFGQQFVVDNRAGAGGTIGAELVARANPDGYTFIVVASTYASSAALYKLPYDPVEGIAPVTIITSGPLVLAVNPSLKATNLKEFIELARAKPGALNFGSSGTGGVPHLAAELFRQMTKTNMVHVPYKGDTPALTDLVGGHIQLMFSAPLVMSPQIKAGRLRGIAVTTEQRSQLIPELPAVSEQVPGYSAITWFGTWAPAGTPREIVARLNQSLARILKQSDVQERLRADGMEPAHSTPEEFARFMAREIAKWSQVVKAGNIKID